jgi:hypothetical protein
VVPPLRDPACQTSARKKKPGRSGRDDKSTEEAGVHSKLGELGEGDEVAGGVFYADFFGAVEGGAFGEIDFGAFDRGFDGFEIFDFEIEEGGAFANVGGDGGEIVVGAGIGLVHNFGAAPFESYEGEFAAFGNFDGFSEAELVEPEGENGFDFFDEEDRGDFFNHEDFSFCS